MSLENAKYADKLSPRQHFTSLFTSCSLSDILLFFIRHLKKSYHAQQLLLRHTSLQNINTFLSISIINVNKILLLNNYFKSNTHKHTTSNNNNQLAKIIHQQLAFQFSLVDFKVYSVGKGWNSCVLLYWDRSIITDWYIVANRPDKIIVDRVDIALPHDDSVVSSNLAHESPLLLHRIKAAVTSYHQIIRFYP